ncbi:MAG: VCBS repeat-containing protein [Planctomycetales bacterium]|nr:VCBS repeat-containing protein [Planctomycetales bacterium]
MSTFRSSNRKPSRRTRIEPLENRCVLAAVPFVETVVYNEGISRSQSVQTADLDGDGDIDATALSAGDLLTFLNDGSGGFGDPIKSTGTLPGDARSLLLADFDGDGDVDAIAGSIGNEEADHSTVTLFQNDGTGNLILNTTALLLSSEDGFVDDIAMGDIDGDGDMDVVAAGRGSSQVFLLKNVGGGEFAAPMVVSGDFLEPRAVHVTDMDGDGDMDIVGTASYEDTEGHHVFWYENSDGKGTFGSDPASIVDTPAEPRFLDSADIDGDGDMDLVVPFQGVDANAIGLITNTNGVLDTAVALAVNLDGVERTRFVDIDGDSDLDIMATVDNAGQVIWLENTDGAGTFSEVKFVSEDTVQASGLSIADLDGDGDMDAMSTSQFAAQVSVHLNDGSGTFATSTLTPDNAIDPNFVLLADIDGDGDQDFVGQSDFDFEIAWYENDGTGIFGGQNMIVDYDYPPNPDLTPTVWWDIQAGDMDGDGDVDIITSEPNFADTIIWYENVDGNGDFSEIHTFAGQNADNARLVPLVLSIVDFDGDGDNDVVTNQVRNSPGVGWYENIDGQGTLEPREAIAIEEHSALGKHFVGDIDGDGDLDVLVGDNNLATVASVVWYETIQTEDGTLYDEIQIIKTDQYVIDAVQLVDMDDDGDLDVLIASYPDLDTDSTIEWFENTDGKGTFAAAGTLVGTQFVVSQLNVVDLDGDGDKDIVAPGQFEGLIEVFDNNGDGTFSEYTVNAEPFPQLTGKIGVGDINGDGKIDVIAGKGDENAYVAYIQLEIIDNKFDLNADGNVDGADGDLLYASIRNGSEETKFDLNGDGSVSNLDMITMMSDGLGSSVGDSNYNGVFGTDDLVLVFQAGVYEDNVAGNATWATGDWNVDGDFTTNDLVFVFTNGNYQGAAGATPIRSQLAGSVDGRGDGVQVLDDNDVAVVVEDIEAGKKAELLAQNVDEVFADADEANQLVSDDRFLEEAMA